MSTDDHRGIKQYNIFQTNDSQNLVRLLDLSHLGGCHFVFDQRQHQNMNFGLDLFLTLSQGRYVYIMDWLIINNLNQTTTCVKQCHIKQ